MSFHKILPILRKTLIHFSLFHLKAAKQREDELQCQVKAAETDLQKSTEDRIALELQHKVHHFIFDDKFQRGSFDVCCPASQDTVEALQSKNDEMQDKLALSNAQLQAMESQIEV